MNMKLFNDLFEWSKLGRRSVKIEMEYGYIKIYCWDSDLMAGQYIKESLDELNLIEQAIKNREKQLEKLKQLKEGLNG
ncbi:MAG TPA: hypothetical protein PKK61_01125 [Defluviitaleaceae bacterium]|nr:hypothetical protein [Defluviitaleaceae bacterium]